MDPGGPRWTQVDPCRPKWPNWTQVDPSGHKRTQVYTLGAKWCQVEPNGSKWSLAAWELSENLQSKNGQTEMTWGPPTLLDPFKLTLKWLKIGGFRKSWISEQPAFLFSLSCCSLQFMLYLIWISEQPAFLFCLSCCSFQFMLYLICPTSWGGSSYWRNNFTCETHLCNWRTEQGVEAEDGTCFIKPL